MKKFTKLFLALTLMIVGWGSANAAEKQVDLQFKCEEYCAATWDAATNTFQCGKGGWNTAWTFMAAQGISGDISSYTLLHLKMESFTNSSEELTVVFKENDNSNPPSGPTHEFVAKPNSDGIWELDLTDVDWTIDITKLQDLTIYGGARTNEEEVGSVIVSEAYMIQEVADEEPSVEEKLELVHEADYSKISSYGFWSAINEAATATITVSNSLLTVTNAEATAQNHYVQYFGDDGIALEEGEEYVVKVTAKSDADGSFYLGLGGWSDTQGEDKAITAGNELAEYSIRITAKADETAHVMLQTGKLAGTIQYGKVSVYKVVKSSGEEEEDVDPGVVAIPEGYISLIANGTLDESNDVSSFFIKVAPAEKASPAEITEGVGRGKSNGLHFTSAANVTNPWDSQCWVVFTKKIPSGTKFHIEFDYKASATTSIPSQQQDAGCNYLNNNDVPFSITASDKWKHVSKDWTATVDMQSLAFNLNQVKDQAIDFYFDNFVAYMEKPVAITEWVELVDPDESFVSKEQGKNADPWLISSQDGEVTVLSADGASVDWDSQFFIKLSKKLPKGTKYKFSIEYKADKEAHVYMQSHKAPGAYTGNGNYGDFTCGTSYATHTKGTDEAPGVTNDDGIWTIAFNLAQNKSATTFNFKNISFKVPADVYETLENAPDAEAEPEPSITIASEYATFVPAYSMNIGNNEDLVAYNVAYNAEKNSVELTETSKLPVGQAILLHAEGGADTFSDGIEIERILDAQTGLKAAAGGDNPTKGDGSTIYVLANGKKGWGFYLLAADVVIPVGKGYLQIEAAGGREFIGFADDATTVKALENLKKSGTIYNLAGQQVKNAQKGIFIIDGKKTILK